VNTQAALATLVGEYRLKDLLVRRRAEYRTPVDTSLRDMPTETFDEKALGPSHVTKIARDDPRCDLLTN
jgi:hypothetical protein